MEPAVLQGSTNCSWSSWHKQTEPSHFAKRMRYTVMIWPVIRYRTGYVAKYYCFDSALQKYCQQLPYSTLAHAHCFKLRQGMGRKGSCNTSFISLVVNAEAWNDCTVLQKKTGARAASCHCFESRPQICYWSTSSRTFSLCYKKASKTTTENQMPEEASMQPKKCWDSGNGFQNASLLIIKDP